MLFLRQRKKVKLVFYKKTSLSKFSLEFEQKGLRIYLGLIGENSAINSSAIFTILGEPIKIELR